MNIRYIAMERQYGSGGTRIARRAAEACGMACYGRELLERVAKDQQISIQALEDYEESVSGSLLYSMFVMSQSQTGDPDLLSGEAKLCVAEHRIIRELAAEGPAVFVGHCAAQALKEENGVLRVFLQAEEPEKQRRIVEEYGIPAREAPATSRRFDQKRSKYYAFCTGKKWNDLKNYDLILNTSILGEDACVEVLKTLVKG